MRARTNLVVSLICGLLSCAQFAQCQTAASRFEVGGQYTYFHQQHGFFVDNNMLGGRVDIRVARFVWVSSQVDVGLKDYPPPYVSSASGGRLIVGSFGAKVGKEKRRVGLFGEARGGFLSWSDVLTFLEPPSGIAFGRLTRPILYLGGASEFYAGKRIGFRISAGDAICHYPKVTIVPGEPKAHGFTANNVQVSTGVFYRF